MPTSWPTARRSGWSPSRTAAPLVDLDKPYKLVNDFDARFPAGAPSLIDCERLTVKGDWTFGKDVRSSGSPTVAGRRVAGHHCRTARCSAWLTPDRPAR